MRLQTILVKRGARFYFRSRVPDDLKAHYKKNEFFLSLRTSDKRIADYELAKLKAELYSEFARLRGENFQIESSVRTQLIPLYMDATRQPINDTGPTVAFLSNIGHLKVKQGHYLKRTQHKSACVNVHGSSETVSIDH